MANDSNYDIRKIIQKLGHDLHEVRLRSLQNILSKVNNGIVSIEELVHIRDLYVFLLEWLKQPLNNQDEIHHILGLLHSLSELPAGGQLLIDLGGVEIFSLLRQSLANDEKSHELIDSLLNNLFLVHNEVDTQAVSEEPQVQETLTCTYNSHEYSAEKSTEILLQYNALKENQHSTFQSALIDSVTLEAAQDIPLTPQHPGDSSSSLGTTSHSVVPQISVGNENLHLRNSFPWIPLTSGDRQILSVTENRLQSASPELIAQSCQFLRCVLFHDFPAEVFIQRPSIFRTLLSIIGKYEGKSTEIVSEILGCLIELTKNLRKRFLLNLREDLQVAPVQCDEEDFETTLMTECFMQDQCSLTEYALKSLLASVNLLKLYFKENRLFSEVILLNVTVVKLLHNTDFKSYWGDTTGNKTVYGLLTLFHKFNTTITDIPVPDRPSVDLDGQLSEVKFVMISRVLTKLILTTVPDERLYEALTEGLVIFLERMICNVTILSHMSSLRSALEKILKHADEKFYNRYVEATRIVKSMITVDKWKQCIEEKEKFTNDEILTIMQEVISSVQYHGYEDFIQSSVELCCEKFKQVLQEGGNHWCNMLYTLIRHPSTIVLRKVYASVLRLMKTAFSESLVTTPLSVKHQLATVLVEKNMLNEIVTHGINHKDETVSNTSRSLVTTLLISRLNMSAEMWKSVLQNLSLLIPTLQGYLGSSDEAYNKALFALVEHPYTILDAEGRSSGLSSLEQMRLLMRLFFMRAEKVRSKAFPLILPRLINRNKDRKVVRTYPSGSEFSMGDVFVFSVQRLAVLVGSSSCFEDITHDNVERLWEVVRDVVVNEELRHSAAEQLAILTKDSLLQNRIMQNDSYTFLVDEISKLVSTRSASEHLAASKYLLSLLKILKNILATHAAVRHVLALQEVLYLDLVEIAIVAVRQEEIRYEISSILTYLLFCDLFTIPEETKDKLLLPRDMRHNYRFPIEFSFPSKHKAVQSEVLLPDDVLWSFIKHSCSMQSQWFAADDTKSKCDSVVHVTRQEKALYINGVSSLISAVSQGLATAPDHFHAISHLGSLNLLLYLCDRLDSHGTLCNEVSALVEDLVNDGLIKKIISKPPISDNDSELFNSLIFVLRTVLELNVEELIPSFYPLVLSQSVANIISDQTGSRQSDGKPDLRVKQGLITLISSTLNHKNQSLLSSRMHDANKEVSISNLVVSLYQNLSVGGSESYYNLPLLEVMLESFTHLLAYRKWSISLNKNICHQLFHWLSQVVVSFHFDRSFAGVSFMGKGIVKKAVICLCHMAREICIIEGNTLTWTSWLKNEMDGSTENNGDLPRIPWVVPLLSDRLIDVRWGALALSSALIMEKSGEEVIINEYQSLPGGIWATIIHILLDTKECFMVRKQGCALLTNLICRAVAQLEHDPNVWSQMVVQDTDSQIKVTGVDAFFMLLDHLDFFSQLESLFSHEEIRNNVGSFSVQRPSSSIGEVTLHFRGESSAVGGNSLGSIEDSSSVLKGARMDNIVCKSERKHQSVSYKSSLLNLLSNLIALAPHIVIKKMNQYQILPCICNVWSPSIPLELLRNKKEISENSAPDEEVVAHLKCFQSVLVLFSAVLSSDEDSFSVLLLQNDILPKVLLAFQLCLYADEQYLPFYLPLWKEAISLTENILKLSDNDKDGEAYHIVKRHLQYIGGSLLVSAAWMKGDNTLVQRFLQLIFLAMKEMPSKKNVGCPSSLESFKLNEEFLEMLRKNDNIVTYISGEEISLAEFLCVVLIHTRSRFGTSKISSLCATTLAYVFKQCETARHIAFKNGFVETLVEETRDLIVRINVTSSLDRKTMSKRKLSLIHDLCCLLTLIRDFNLYDNAIKASFINDHLLSHLQSIWGLSCTDQLLRRCLLQLLVVLSNNCEDAQLGMCATVVESTLCEEVSFLGCIMKLLLSLHEGTTVNGKFDTCLPLCFDILVNLSSQSQCRHVIIKSNLLNLFVNAHSLVYSPKKLFRNNGRKVLGEWIKLTAVISFHTDAAKALGKVAGSSNVIVEIIKNGSLPKKIQGLITLRNLLFIQGHKQTLTSDAEILECVISQLNNKSQRIKLLVVSFLWVALYENQKARVFLKKMNLMNELCNVKNSLSDDILDDVEASSKEHLRMVVANVQALLLKGEA